MEYIDEMSTFFFTCRPAFPLWRREAGECKQVGDDIRYISTFFHLPSMGHSMGYRHKHIFCAITELLVHQRKRIFCAIAAILQRSMETLPKAQRTRGSSSAYQSNIFRSYHKFLHKS